VDETNLGEEIFDHRAVRVVVKVVDQWKKRDRKNWMRKSIPNFPKLIHRYPRNPTVHEGKCCRLNEIGNDDRKFASELLSRVFLVALRSLVVTADSHVFPLFSDRNFQALPPVHSSELITTSMSQEAGGNMARTDQLVPRGRREEFARISPLGSWKSERRHLMHFSACDFLAALQIIFMKETNGEYFTLDDLEVMKILATVAKSSISPHRRKAFTSGQKPSDEVFQVKSSLIKIAPCWTENPAILTDMQILNFRTHLIVNDRGREPDLLPS
jgi:hypothetical protein